jgi:hypothetical protein
MHRPTSEKCRKDGLPHLLIQAVERREVDGDVFRDRQLRFSVKEGDCRSLHFLTRDRLLSQKVTNGRSEGRLEHNSRVVTQSARRA